MPIRLLLIFFCLLFANISNSQVFNLIPGITAKLNYVKVSDVHGIAVMGGLEHYVSSDQGLTWTEMNNNTASDLINVEGNAIAIINASTYCIVGYNYTLNKSVIVRTTDGGTTWNNVVIATMSTNSITDIDINGNILVASAYNGIYRSTDGGLNWTYISITLSNQTSSFVRYNVSANSWMVGSYSTNFHVSTDDGLTWTQTNLGFTSSTTLSATGTNNGVLLTKDNSSSTHFYFVDNTNAISDTINVQDNLAHSLGTCSTAVFLPNNKLLTLNNFIFHLVDPSNEQVYFINSPAASNFKPKKIATGANYGIALTLQNSPLQGKAYLIDYNSTPALSVAATFSFASPAPCAGDPIIATANATYADSVKWKVNNVLVSTSTTLNYPTPSGVYTTYTVQLTTYFNGNANTSSQNVTIAAPSAPHHCVYTLNTNACYGLPLNVLIDPDPGTPWNTAIKILFNGQLVYGPYVFTSTANVNAYTTPLTSSGILQVIAYKNLPCDPSADTTEYVITIGPNLETYTLLTNDTIICTGIQPEMALTGTNSSYSYDLVTTYTIPTLLTSHTNLVGNSLDTTSALLPSIPLYIDNDPSTATYGPMYMYVSLTVNDNNGCSISSPIDTIRIQRPTAYFELHSRSFLRDDTVHLSNAYVTENRMWSSPELNPIYISNETDTVPLIIPDTTGFFGIQLRNEPLPGCVDTMINYVQIGDPASNLDPFCNYKRKTDLGNYVSSHYDKFGNIYELKAYGAPGNYAPLYILRKNDPDGNTLWEKKATYTGWGTNTMYGITIQSIDFDCDGNPIIGMWIQGKTNYTDAIFNFTPVGNVVESWCFVAKLDKQTGDIIWRKRLNDLPGAANLTERWRVTDLVVDDEFIHVSTYAQYNLDFFTLNTADGSFVTSSPFNFGSWNNSPFIPPSFIATSVGSVSDNRESYYSPQLDVLSTGEVIAIGNYIDIPLAAHPELDINGSLMGVFAMKYKPFIGVYDVDKIAQIGAWGNDGASHLITERVNFFVDKHDQINIASLWMSNSPNVSLIHVLDSVLPMKSGTFLLNMTPSYEMNWITLGTHSFINDFGYSKETGEIFLTCSTNKNFSMGNQHSTLMAGIDDPLSIQYTNVPGQYALPWQCFPENRGFLVKIDSLGTPTNMKLFNAYNDLKLATTPCGDLAVLANCYTNGTLEVDGLTLPTDSTIIFFLKNDCSALCSYVSYEDTIRICATTTHLDIQLCDYFNLELITYDLLFNGSAVLSNQSAAVTEGLFTLPIPLTLDGDYSVSITNPNAATITIANSVIGASSFNYNDTVCDGTVVQIDATPTAYQYDWGFDNGPSISINSTMYDLGLNEFPVTTTNSEGCTYEDTVELFIDDCLSLTENETLRYRLSPNPANGKFSIDLFTLTDEISVEILDLRGNLIYHERFSNTERIDLDLNLVSSTYLVRMITKNGTLNELIVVN